VNPPQEVTTPEQSNSAQDVTLPQQDNPPQEVTPSRQPYAPNQTVFRSRSTRECRPREPVGRINFDCNLTDANYETLRRALEFLKRMELRGPAAERLQQMLHLPTPSGEALFNWMEDKIRFILDQTFASSERCYSARSENAFFLRNYRNPYAIVEVPGYGPVEVNSQRVGIVQLGVDFFDSHAYRINERNVETINRLATLIHETRHNQGRGISFAFSHERCPVGHREAGQFSCDPCNNGSYAIESLFFESALAGCDQCNDLERALLRVDQNYSQSQVLPNAIECDAELQYP
jgi:hypothetical protein